MKRSWLLLVLTSSACLAPAAAQASITASLAGGVLTVSSDNGGNVNETFTLRDAGSSVVVTTSPALTADPDGVGTDCQLNAGEAFCTLNAVDSVRVLAGNGTDAITDNRATGPSTLEGGPGDDTITTTTSGTDAELLGQAGLDHLTSADPADVLTGGDDADTLTALGAKALNNSDGGGPGNDTFVGNADLGDALTAEAGSDTYTLGTHVATGGESADPAKLQFSYEDVVSYANVTGPVAVRLDGAANDGRTGEQDDVRADVERVVGTDAGDLLQAGPNAVGFSGLDGNDQLTGGPGPDTLSGDGGNDVVRGGDGDDELSDGDFTPTITSDPLPAAGNDVLDGGNGADLLLSDRGADDLSGGPGLDRATFDRPIPQAPSVPTPVVAAGFTVSLDDVANDGQTGTGEGDNVRSDVEDVVSAAGNDAITGSGAANDINSGAGNDVVDPGGGPDVVTLGVGDDRIFALDQTTDVIRCGAGSDAATADLPGPQAVLADAVSDCESVTGAVFVGVTLPGPGGPGPGVPASDKTRPAVTLSGKTIRSKGFLANGRLDLTVACNEACSATGKASTSLLRTARGGALTVGTGKLKLGTGKRTLRITVAKRHRTKLRSKLRTKAQKRRGVTFRVAVTVKDAAGNVRSASRSVTVKG